MTHNQRVAAAQAFRSAVDAASSQSAFYRRTGLKQQTVSNLLRRGDVIPAEYVLVTEREFGVSKHLLRPDLYPDQPASVRSNDTPAFDQDERP